jgi:hypothetical protein
MSRQSHPINAAMLIDKYTLRTGTTIPNQSSEQLALT